MVETAVIKKIPIESYLKIEPVKRKSGYGMYHSVLRDDKNPSFKIDYKLNLWCDYGTNEGGDIIDLVQKLKNCSFVDAVKELNGGDYFSFQRQNSTDCALASTTEIISVTDISDGALLSYCASRGVSEQVARDNLCQVKYRCGEREFVNFGMQNSVGGWELFGLNRFKRVIGQKSHSLIKGRDSGECCVFEGIFDYLSSLMLGDGNSMPKYDCFVLNSVNTLAGAMSSISHYKVVNCLLDNDEAGWNCLKSIKSELGEKCTIRSYSFYDQYNDLNDYLKSCK